VIWVPLVSEDSRENLVLKASVVERVLVEMKVRRENVEQWVRRVLVAIPALLVCPELSVTKARSVLLVLKVPAVPHLTLVMMRRMD